MSVADRVRQPSVLSTVGYRLVQLAYNHSIRRHLPSKYRLCAGVAVKDIPLFDTTSHFPEYKHGLLSGIADCVDEGDRVVIVGGGYGVSSIHAARSGAIKTIAYEAAADMLEVYDQTIQENYYPAECDIDLRHGLVGPNIGVSGDASGAVAISPIDLPACDVLVLDCEGAELEILRAMESLPEQMVIETHEQLGTSADAVAGVLDNADVLYEVREYEPSRDLDKPVFVCGFE